MSSHSTEISNAIISWIENFDFITSPPKSIQDLCDGIALCEIMHKIAPSIFDPSTLNHDCRSQWALCVANLTTLNASLDKFYTSVLNKSYNNKYFDTVEISKNQNVGEIHKLVEVVLGAAVQCEERELFIQGILKLEESYQSSLMILIEKSITEEGNPNPEPSTGLTESHFRLSGGMTNSMVIQKSHQENQLLGKLEEAENEIYALKRRIKELEEEKSESDSKLNDMHSEFLKKEQEAKEYRIKYGELQETMSAQDESEELQRTLKMRDFKITQLEQTIESMKQEYDNELTRLNNEIAEKQKKLNYVNKLESIAEHYKIKNEEYTDMVKINSELKEDVTKFKRQADDATKALEIQIAKLKSLSNDYENLQKKNVRLEIDVAKYEREVDLLKKEKVRSEDRINELNSQLQEAIIEIEGHRLKAEDTARNHISTARALKEISEGGSISDEHTTHSQPQHQIVIIADDPEKDSLKKQVADLIEELKRVEVEKLELQSQVERSDEKRTLEKLSRDNQRLQEEVDKVKKTLEKERETARESIDTAKISNIELKKLYDNIVEEKKRFEEELRASRKDNAIKENEIKDLSIRLSELESASNDKIDLKRGLHQKESELRQKEEHIKNLEQNYSKEIASKTDECRILSLALGELSNRLIDMETQLLKKPSSGYSDQLSRANPLSRK